MRDHRHTKRSLRMSKKLGYEVVEVRPDFCNGPCCMTVIKHGKVDEIRMHPAKKHRPILVRVDEEEPDREPIHIDSMIVTLVVAFIANLIWFIK